MNERDREGLQSGMHGLAVEPDLAGIGSMDAGEYLDQRRLAGAVFAEQRVDFPALHDQIDVVKRQRARKSLADPAQAEQRIRVRERSMGACAYDAPQILR